MTGEQKIIEGMKTDPGSLAMLSKTMYDLYYDEFGSTWINHEMGIAETYMKDAFKGRPSNLRNFGILLDNIYKDIEDKHKGVTNFIAARQVTGDQFIYYSKGIYFLAAYHLSTSSKKLKS